MKRVSSTVAVLMAIAAPAFATDWITTIEPTDGYAGAYGTITFDDWGYTGPAGTDADDFVVGSGFDSSRIGQIQRVRTRSADWKTSDPPADVETDLGAKGYLPYTPLPNANMDAQVNFYRWAYTTPAGSTFNNMQIDKAGNYHVAKDDMSFGFYDYFDYNNGTTIEKVDSGINFQPYAISDAQGWCGSVLVQNPNGLGVMAGQVTFDFAFDVYFNDGEPGDFVSTQIVPGFIMRSYGDYEVDITTLGLRRVFEGSAVANNSNPETGELDADFQNLVSFLGAGVIPEFVWVINEGTPDVQVVDEGTPGATLHRNDFAGYAFLLRADAERTLEYIAPDGHSDYVNTVPVPAALPLFGSALFGLGLLVRRRMRS